MSGTGLGRRAESDPGTWFGHIVPGTGTGAFAGWSGSARIVHDDQGAYFEIELAYERPCAERPAVPDDAGLLIGIRVSLRVNTGQ